MDSHPKNIRNHNRIVYSRMLRNTQWCDADPGSIADSEPTDCEWIPVLRSSIYMLHRAREITTP